MLADTWNRLVDSAVWLTSLLTLTLLMTALSASVVRTADHHRVTLLLADTTTAVNRPSALKWQAISEQRLNGELRAQVRGNRAHLVDLQSQLGAVSRADVWNMPATVLHNLLFGRHWASTDSLASVTNLLGTFLDAVDR